MLQFLSISLMSDNQTCLPLVLLLFCFVAPNDHRFKLFHVGDYIVKCLCEGRNASLRTSVQYCGYLLKGHVYHVTKQH